MFVSLFQAKSIDRMVKSIHSLAQDCIETQCVHTCQKHYVRLQLLDASPIDRKTAISILTGPSLTWLALLIFRIG